VIDVELSADREIPRDMARAAAERVGSLDRYAGSPLFGARLTLRRGSPHSKLPYVADASVLLDGRLLAAHATGPSPLEAADSVADRLRRQLRRVIGADMAQRNEPAVIQAALADLEPQRRHRPAARLKPPAERSIVHRRTYVDVPLPTLDAVADLLDLDIEFYLFRHARTPEDVVVYRRDDGRIGLIHPQGSILADEDDVVAPEPSRYSAPLTLDAVRTEMDMLNHRFLYFIDAGDGRGKVLYLRHDGDYGLVQPA
jgi:ribosome-associated translation inhibitor RaiA